MLDHIDDFKKLTDKDVNDIKNVMEKSFATLLGSSKHKEALYLALLIDIAQNLREINDKLTPQENQP